MKKLSRQNIAQRDAIIKKLADAAGALEEEQEALTEALDAFNAKIDAYNEALEEAREFTQDMASEIDSYMSERSERWLDGDAGQAYEEWKSEWENVELEDLEHIETPDFPEPDHIETLEQAPEEPNQ